MILENNIIQKIINYKIYLAQLMNAKEDKSNKITSTIGISSTSTDATYPSTKAVYDYIDDVIGDIQEDMMS